LTGYHTTAQAKSDLLEIGRFAQQRWGRTRIEYLARVESTCSRLADNPSLGRSRDECHFGDAVIDDGNERVVTQLALNGVDQVCGFQAKGLGLCGKGNDDKSKRCENQVSGG